MTVPNVLIVNLDNHTSSILPWSESLDQLFTEHYLEKGTEATTFPATDAIEALLTSATPCWGASAIGPFCKVYYYHWEW